MRLVDIAPQHGGLEDADRLGAWYFPNSSGAVITAKALGATLQVPAKIASRPCYLIANKHGILQFEVTRKAGDEFPAAIERNRPNRWVCSLGVSADQRSADEQAAELLTEVDKKLRYLVADDPNGGLTKVAMYMADANGQWAPERDSHTLHCRLQYCGIADKLQRMEWIGVAAEHPFKLIRVPFAPEFPDPSKREWNLHAPQLAIQPSQHVGFHPTWDKVLRHCFIDLDGVLPSDEWAQSAGIRNGLEYGRAWIASLIRHPKDHLPFLYFYGPQNSGKSTFHEAIAMLFTSGVASADRALKNDTGYNAELAFAVLAYIEELDLSSSRNAYARIKDWTTSPTLPVRKMRTDLYHVENWLHFVMCSNDRSHLKFGVGDTRITVCHVPPPDVEIPKGKLMESLRAEAPFFLRTLLNLSLPEPIGRLRLQPIRTASKEAMELETVHPLALQVAEFVRPNSQWIGTAKQLAEHCDECPTDFRRVWSALSDTDTQRYLQLHGIDISDAGKGEHGRRLLIKRKAA